MKVKRFERNLIGKDYVVGDIHGCFTKLDCELYTLGFREATDRLFSVGDLVDRGGESEKCLEWLAKPWFHAVKGNHELMIINAYRQPDVQNNAYFSLVNGGEWFVDRQGFDQLDYVKAFEALPYLIEIDTPKGLVGIVHAEVDTNWEHTKRALNSNDKWTIEKCLWSRSKIKAKDTTNFPDVYRVYSGHTPVNDYIILGNQYYIDTGAVFEGGKLTILEI